MFKYHLLISVAVSTVLAPPIPDLNRFVFKMAQGFTENPETFDIREERRLTFERVEPLTNAQQLSIETNVRSLLKPYGISVLAIAPDANNPKPAAKPHVDTNAVPQSQERTAEEPEPPASPEAAKKPTTAPAKTEAPKPLTKAQQKKADEAAKAKA